VPRGDEGLRKIARRPPDLLITDYAHPGPRAEEMLHRLLRTRISFPILVASGYLGDSFSLVIRLDSARMVGTCLQHDIFDRLRIFQTMGLMGSSNIINEPFRFGRKAARDWHGSGAARRS
jgi:hypothetical protein